jgi:aminoglycoside phosphotransferase (APT) family kinase protein
MVRMPPEEDLAAEPTPLAGGFSGETFLSGSGEARVVVRIYGGRSVTRGPQAVDVDAALLRLMRGIVPVPEVLEVRRPAGDLPALLVTEFLPGERADLLLPTLDADGRADLGTNLGRLLDRLAHVPTLRGGRFVDGDLRIDEFPGVSDGLPGWVDAHREALTGWDEDALSGLASLAERAQDLSDAVDRTCLVHSDFNPKNLLVDPETLEVTGLLDWEFAHSGSPYTDLGNLLRFERDEAFTTGVLTDYGDPDLELTLDLARAADLFALVDLAARDHDAASRNPVTTAANDLLRAMADSGDLHAPPVRLGPP